MVKLVHCSQILRVHVHDYIIIIVCVLNTCIGLVVKLVHCIHDVMFTN